MEYIPHLTIAAYNVAIAYFCFRTISGFDFKSALSEKDPDVVNAQANAVAQIANTNIQVAAAQVANPQIPPVPPVPDPLASSYSRITGMFGLIIMAAFLWALGNALIWSMFNAADNVSKIITNIGTFFLSGSALFAPYAFNQIKSAFGK